MPQPIVTYLPISYDYAYETLTISEIITITLIRATIIPLIMTY
ncbi:hypothetical protein Vsou_17470 [Vulcanisaeta souniana JCM 11219]|uniref:Uncharacterized protein n=1 Tax=Vulcanisaeta souniana JCM 11219 TaxID=1293586 RepID=A0ABN6SSP3_9CREN|nr:hypothetical protein Vsou_17470 [Vulcanisaeta souniana JCM 11219]